MDCQTGNLVYYWMLVADSLGVQSKLTSKWQAALLDMDLFNHKLGLNVAWNESEITVQIHILTKMSQNINLKHPHTATHYTQT